MKLTTAAVLAFTATSVLGNPISFKATATVSARDLYERDGSEGFLESFEKRGGATGSSSLFKSVLDMLGIMGGRVVNSSMQNGMSKHFFPPAKPSHTPKPPPHQVQMARRSLRAPAKRRALSRPVSRGTYYRKTAPARKTGRVVEGIVARGLEQDDLDELD